LHDSSVAHGSNGSAAGVQNGAVAVGGSGDVAAPAQQKKLLRLGYRELQV
jgi:hypothetical protein